jgi:hypothetical protein
VTAAALALWLALAGAPAAAAPPRAEPRMPPPFAWSIPEVLDDVPVGGTAASGGRPMKLRAVRSRWDADRLRKKLAEDFLRAGLYIPPPRDQPQNLPLPYLAALDGRRMISYSVLFQVNRDGSTTLVLGEVDLEARADVKAPAPVFPGAVDVLASDVEALRAVSYRARATAPEVLAFYRDVLGRAGFQDAGGGAFERGNERLAVMTKPGPDGFVRVIVTLRTEVAQGPGARPAAGK